MFALASLVTSFSAHALDIGGIKLSGEVSFDYNNLSSGDNYYPANGGAGNDQYRLYQGQLVAAKETDEFSFLARFNYQPLEVTTTGTATTKQNFGTLEQLEIYYKIRPEFIVGFGRLCSTMGYESLNRSENTFYTNTVTYQSLVPGYGEGVRLRYNPGDYLSLTLSSYNRSTYNLYGDDYTPTKTTEFSATGAWNSLTWFGGYYFGTDRDSATPTQQVEKKAGNAWVSYKFTEAFVAAVTFDSRAQKPNGGSEISAQSITAQLSYTWLKHTFGLRYESLTGADNLDALNSVTGVFYSGGDKLQVWTIGDRIQIADNLHLHLEYRQDVMDTDIFKDKDGGDTDHLHMFTVGAVAYF